VTRATSVCTRGRAPTTPSVAGALAEEEPWGRYSAVRLYADSLLRVVDLVETGNTLAPGRAREGCARAGAGALIDIGVRDNGRTCSASLWTQTS
jgi:hypothetical protein